MYLGLDLGTSGLKAVLINDDQNAIASAHSDLTVDRPQSGWSQQDPAGWVAACEAVLGALGRKADLSAVRGIGLSGQMHGATALAADDSVLYPSILWNDTRSAAEAAAMDADPAFRSISGNIVFPGFTAPKVAWLKAHEPELAERIACVLLPKDYLRLWLTGEKVSEMSDAAGTSWLDTGARDWSDELLSKTGLTRDHMPRLVEGSERAGDLRADLANRFGLPAGIPVAGGGGDNAASAIGIGAVRPGEGFLSLGTSGVLFVSNEAYRPDPATAVHTFCHAVPETWHQMGVILAATDALAWYGKLVGEDPADLTGRLGSLQAPSATCFLPYLGGERTPLNDAAIRGAFVGLEHATDRDMGTRAIMDGVAFAMRDCQEALAATGTTIEHLIAVGGGSRSRIWLEAMATVLSSAIHVPADGDLGGAFGAARLGLMAATGAGLDVVTTPETADVIEPNQTLQSAYEDAYAGYKAAQTAIQDLPGGPQ
ncbi:MAG: xylulokinase [Pseudomonadota bacterium]